MWNFFTIEVLDFSSSQIGIALGAFGLGFALSQALLIGPVIKLVGEWTTVLLGMVRGSHRADRHGLHPLRTARFMASWCSARSPVSPARPSTR